MNMTEWELGLALLVVALAVGGFGHWRHRRQMQALQEQIVRLETSQQTALRLGAQARKQVEELQRLVAEYRRRIAATVPARRAGLPVMAEVVMQVAETAASAPTPPRLPPGGWADTQPM